VKLLTMTPFMASLVKAPVLSSALVLLFLLKTTFYTHTELQFFFRVLIFRFFDDHSKILIFRNSGMIEMSTTSIYRIILWLLDKATINYCYCR
jgi:hypothetical protein